MLTRDINLDWSAVPDMGQKLPAGIIQFKVVDYEEKMSSAEGMTAKGEQKVAKYMIMCKLEAMAPEEAAGITRDEYFVLGSNDDPLMQKAETFYGAIGARQLKKMLGDAQVPWSASLVATLNSSKGAMFLMAVKHKMEKARDGSLDEVTGQVRQFVGVDTGRTYKLGEVQPRLIPCGLAQCEQCREAAASAGHAPAAAMPSVAAPSMPQMSAPPVNHVPQSPAPSAPVSPSFPPSVPSPAQAMAGLGKASGGPPPASHMPHVAPPAAPMPVAPVVQPSTAMCKICGLADIPLSEFADHLQACAMGTQAQVGATFKQEV